MCGRHHPNRCWPCCCCCRSWCNHTERNARVASFYGAVGRPFDACACPVGLSDNDDDTRALTCTRVASRSAINMTQIYVNNIQMVAYKTDAPRCIHTHDRFGRSRFSSRVQTSAKRARDKHHQREGARKTRKHVKYKGAQSSCLCKYLPMCPCVCVFLWFVYVYDCVWVKSWRPFTANVQLSASFRTLQTLLFGNVRWAHGANTIHVDTTQHS